MSVKKLSGVRYLYHYIVPRVVGIGAGVVIVGALFKIMHWEGAGTMLTIGLLTEAFIFILYGVGPIDPPHEEADWSVLGNIAPQGPPKDEKVALKLAAIEASLAESITPDKVKNLGIGMKDLADNVTKMSALGDASVATAEYAKNVKLASGSLVEMNKSYSSTMTAMTAMADASKDAKNYHAQIQNLTKTLSSLNASYEMELQDSKKYITALNKYYGGLATAMESVVGASKDAEQFKTQLSGLTTNLTSLNKVYGSMLSAMKGAQA